MQCKNCGNLLNPNDQFCSNCGEKVSEENTPQTITSSELIQQEKPENNFNSLNQHTNNKQQNNVNQIPDNQIKKNKNILIISIIIAVLTVLSIGIVVFNRSNYNTVNTKSSTLLKNTKWRGERYFKPINSLVWIYIE